MAAELTAWQKEFQLKTELNQGDFEELELALQSLPLKILRLSSRAVDSAVNHGAILRAAIEADWITAPACQVLTDDKTKEKTWLYAGKAVNDLHPMVVRWLGVQIDNRYNSIRLSQAVPKVL
jgi:hypothetical protein